jgi:hypothetical protein
VAFEEADECVDWLQYLKDGKLHEDAALLQEAKELAAILAADRTPRRNTARIDLYTYRSKYLPSVADASSYALPVQIFQ